MDTAQRLAGWLDKHRSSSLLYAKRLAANDVGITRSHQAGIYVPRWVFKDAFPESVKRKAVNPDQSLSATLSSHNSSEFHLRAIWYNNGSRNEARITRWKQNPDSALVMDPDRLGAIVVLALYGESAGTHCTQCDAWLCDSIEEEDVVEGLLGSLEPGDIKVLDGRRPVDVAAALRVAELAAQDTQAKSKGADPCSPARDELEPSWLSAFPSGEEIVAKVLEVTPTFKLLNLDDRILNRRECEYAFFRAVERAHVLPLIESGFSDIDTFVNVANSVLNRRKSRSGRSLELQIKNVLDEEGFEHYSYDQTTEGKSKPDFIFPSIEAYHSPATHKDELRMLAVKTTLKDRWRQILKEANRIEVKHLMTLQEGVSLPQFEQMREEGVRLVVPKKIHKKYPEEIRSELCTFTDFYQEVSKLYGD